MTERSTTVVFTTLAMNQTVFFEALGRALEQHGYSVAHICFHERSHDYLTGRGVRSFNAFALGVGADERADWSSFGITNPAFLLSHEKAAFEITDTSVLLAKFSRHVQAVQRALDKLAAERQGGRLVIVQELGGFASILASFFVARSRDIDNLFIEPSFFRGRVFFVRNSLAALPLAGPTGKPADREVVDYLDTAVRAKSAVIPRKDAHHYRTASKKIFDPRHMQRLVEKLSDKYLLGKREEFEHIGGHIVRHVRMAVKSRVLAYYYQSLPEHQPFVYYPLHVPADVALTLRSPAYLDQYALIDYLCRVTPYPYQVVIKEHPALVGAVDFRRIQALLHDHDNLILLNAKINNFTVLAAASVVVTVNSKSGAEALLLRKPVLVLGDAFYRPCSLIRRVECLGDLEPTLQQTISSPPRLPRDDIYGYFQDVWENSLPGELYHTEPENIAIFALSLKRMLAESEIEV